MEKSNFNYLELINLIFVRFSPALNRGESLNLIYLDLGNNGRSRWRES